MNVFGNGFLAYHVEVRVASGCISTVKDAVNQWKSECRTQAGWPGFPDTMVNRLMALPDVLKVCCEGPQSSILIPLRMIKNLTDSRCRMSTTIGTGLIAQGIETDLNSWGIDLEPVKRLEREDSPLEFSFRDGTGHSASLVLYPSSRRCYQGSIKQQQDVPEQLILNRYNLGLSTLADQVVSAGGVVSFRPRELGRHDSIGDWASLLASTHHLALSSRHGAMKAFATYLGVTTPRGWPTAISDLHDPVFADLARALASRMPPDAIILLHRLVPGDTLFFSAKKRKIVLPSPEECGNESRMARLQGALLALTMQQNRDMQRPMNDTDWQHLCNETVKLAFHGTTERPWKYPTQDDQTHSFVS